MLLMVNTGLLTGCASIVNGTHQSVNIDTYPASEATCSLSNNEGKWYVYNTPQSVAVHRSSTGMDIHCQKKGYRDANKSVESSIKPIFFGNILFGGIIGVVVDIVDGAAFGYPKYIQVPMRAYG